MNKNELEKKVKELEEELQQVKEELKKSKENWEVGDKYYYINGFGEIIEAEYADGPVDKFRMKMGNMYRTEEAGEFEIEKQKVINELKKYAYEPDWSNENKEKYHMYYAYYLNKILYSFTFMTKTNELYFETEEKARQAVMEVGEDRVKKYYFGVK